MRDWKEIINTLRLWNDIDELQQKALDVLVKTVAPGSYSPILENSRAACFIDGIAFGNKNMKEDLEYIMFEAQSMRGSATVTVGEKSWDMKDDKEMIDYLNTTYNT